MLLPLFRDDGSPVKAQFSVQPTAHGWGLLLESRGGTKGQPSERNPEYHLALPLLIARLAQARLSITDAFVESAELVRQGMSRDERRMSLPFPIELSPSVDLGQIVRAIGRAQAEVGSKRVHGAGNKTRRILLEIASGPGSMPIVDLAAYLSTGDASGVHGVPLGQVTADQLEEAAEGVEDGFDPANLQDARKKILASIAVRQGQPKFRKELLAAYDSRCAVTGCEVLYVLEAAHIVAYAGPDTNHVQNGLLLRADLHTLFDKGLIGIDPGTWTVVVSEKLHGSSYHVLAGSTVKLPAKPQHRPSEAALMSHLRGAGLAGG